MTTAETRELILDAAENLLAEHGYAATSLRRLTAAAGVNLAAVNYHFGGKEELAKAVLERRIAPINAERLRRLDALDAKTIEAIVRAFLEPPLRAAAPGPGSDSGRRMCRMFGRILVEQPPFLRPFLGAQFGGVVRRFVDAFAAASRHPESATTWWRLHFLVGAMAHTLQNAQTIAAMSDGRCDPDDVDALIEEMVAFASAGFAAEAPQAPRAPQAPEAVRR